MDKLHKYINYTFEDFVDDASFWKWVLKEENADDVFWISFLAQNPSKLAVIEQAREKVLSLNQDTHKLSETRVHALWDKITSSKNKDNLFDFTLLTSDATMSLVSRWPLFLFGFFLVLAYLRMLSFWS